MQATIQNQKAENNEEKSLEKSRWVALAVLCLGALMIVLDTTIVNVALPSIRESLGFSAANLAWVVNAYILTFGGFLLLGGRLGDLFGHRKLFIIGILIFTLASLACGVADTQWFLIVARAIQGVGGAVVSAVALSLIMNLFTEPGDRARAMGVYGFVSAGGGSIGVLLGGVLTGTLSWHAIFLVNIPIGILVIILSLFILPPRQEKLSGKVDIAGALTVTLSLMLAVYAIVGGNLAGWGSARTLGAFGGAILLFIVFILVERRVSAPLVPLGIFRLRNVTVANIVGVLWSAAMFAWFFLSALYMQLVLHYTPMKVGLAFLPANLIMALFSLGLSARIVMRYGVRIPIGVGLGLASVGLLLFARAPINGSFVLHVLPNMILLGLGAGIALNPILLSAMSDLPKEESGLASGVMNTSFMMGGALGLATLASLASYYTAKLSVMNRGEMEALVGGYHAAFLVGAIFGVVACVLGSTLLRVSGHQTKN